MKAKEYAEVGPPRRVAEVCKPTFVSHVHVNGFNFLC